MRRRGAGWVRGAALALFLAACAGQPRQPAPPGPASTAWVDRLYLGRSVQGVEAVTEAEWERFLGEVVVPRFPDGFTVLHAEGRWRGAADTTEAERTFVLEVVHPGDSASLAALVAVAREYRARFRQQAVLRVRAPVEATLLRGADAAATDPNR